MLEYFNSNIFIMSNSSPEVSFVESSRYKTLSDGINALKKGDHQKAYKDIVYLAVEAAEEGDVSQARGVQAQVFRSIAKFDEISEQDEGIQEILSELNDAVAKAREKVKRAREAEKVTKEPIAVSISELPSKEEIPIGKNLAASEIITNRSVADGSVFEVVLQTQVKTKVRKFTVRVMKMLSKIGNPVLAVVSIQSVGKKDKLSGVHEGDRFRADNLPCVLIDAEFNQINTEAEQKAA